MSDPIPRLFFISSCPCHSFGSVLHLYTKLDAAIVATRYVYQLRGEKREARMPKNTRPESDLRRLMPGIVRYTDASGATVYSSHSYQPTKGHSRDTSEYSLARFDFEEGSDGGSEDWYWGDPNYKDRGHEDGHTPGLHEMENDGAGHSRTSSRTMIMTHDRNAPEGAFSTG